MPRKLPSRNWMIFIGVVGTWTGLLVYDRTQKKRIRQKWCDLVAPLAHEPLAPNEMQRRMTVILAAPPGDGLLSARDHFHEYVKPVLAAAAMDWEVVEGRREGDVRAGVAERIRKIRRSRGEKGDAPTTEGEEGPDADAAIVEVRKNQGIKEWKNDEGREGMAGEIVIGRHTWKEYIRGLHEGWLGPLDIPTPPAAEQAPAAVLEQPLVEPVAPKDFPPASSETPSDETSPTTPPTPEPEKKEEEPPKPTKPKRPPPFMTPEQYPSATASPNLPDDLPSTTTLPFPHILGISHTPIRIYRYLTRRHLQDDIGRRVAAAVLDIRKPYSTSVPSPAEDDPSHTLHELETPFLNEEGEWFKTVRKRAAKAEKEGKTEADREPGEEWIWTEPMVLDQRIVSRMSKFDMDKGDEEYWRLKMKNLEAERLRREAERNGAADEGRMIEEAAKNL